MKSRFVFYMFMVLFISACSARTVINSKNHGESLRINNESKVLLNPSHTNRYPTTSFGNYKFKLTKDGSLPMYGILPLKFNTGYLITDILFFDLGLLFNLREVYPFYELDIENGIVRYKDKITDPWIIYKPTTNDTIYAKNYFGDHAKAHTSKIISSAKPAFTKITAMEENTASGSLSPSIKDKCVVRKTGISINTNGDISPTYNK